MSGTSSSQQSAPSAQEFVLRAPGAMHKGVDYLLGKFPPGFADFKRKRGGWGVQRREEEPQARRRGPPPKKPRVAPLALEDKPGHTTHLGQPEGGITGSGMGTGYFVMVKEGPHFTVLPVKDWFNFRPATRSQAMSLEEAEKRMSAMERGVRLATGSKLGALAAKAEAEGGGGEEGDGEGEPPDSDEERDAARVSRIRAAHAQQQPEPADDMPSTKAAGGGGERGEDWEHEEERADDDLNQGEEEGSDADVPAADRKDRGIAGGGEPDSGDEGGGGGGGGGLTDAQRELRRVLAATRLGSGSGSSEASDGEEDGDDIDLDAMASGLLPKGGLVPGASGSGGKGEQAEGRPRGKRKAATPPQRADAKKVKPGGAKQEPGAAAGTGGPPSAQEILAALREWGPVTTGELTTRFRKRLPRAQDKQAFMAAVKRVSRLEERPPGSGKKFVVPK